MLPIFSFATVVSLQFLRRAGNSFYADIGRCPWFLVPHPYTLIWKSTYSIYIITLPVDNYPHIKEKTSRILCHKPALYHMQDSLQYNYVRLNTLSVKIWFLYLLQPAYQLSSSISQNYNTGKIITSVKQQKIILPFRKFHHCRLVSTCLVVCIEMSPVRERR